MLIYCDLWETMSNLINVGPCLFRTQKIPSQISHFSLIENTDFWLVTSNLVNSTSSSSGSNPN